VAHLVLVDEAPEFAAERPRGDDDLWVGGWGPGWGVDTRKTAAAAADDDDDDEAAAAAAT